jgi:hypothetical protein
VGTLYCRRGREGSQYAQQPRRRSDSAETTHQAVYASTFHWSARPTATAVASTKKLVPTTGWSDRRRYVSSVYTVRIYNSGLRKVYNPHSMKNKERCVLAAIGVDDVFEEYSLRQSLYND